MSRLTSQQGVRHQLNPPMYAHTHNLAVQLDEVRRLSGGKASLPVVLEEEDESLADPSPASSPAPAPCPPATSGWVEDQAYMADAQAQQSESAGAQMGHATHQLHKQQTSAMPWRTPSAQPEAAARARSAQPQQQESHHAQTGHAQQSHAAHQLHPQQTRPSWAIQQEKQQGPQEAAQSQLPLDQGNGQHNAVYRHTEEQQQQQQQAPRLDQPQSGIHSMPQQGSVKPLADDTRLTKLSKHDSSWQHLHQAVPHQQVRSALPPPSQQRQIGQPCSPKPHGSRNPGTVSPPVHPPASRPPGAVAKAPAKKTAPGVTGAVEHSSLSLHQLAVASRSKLQPPSALNSPPKRGGKAALPKQATSSHLVKLAAAVPLPASPGGIDSATSIEATAAAALATAAAQPSHIPAPAVKPSRLKKPTNTSGFFSSGRSFTGAGPNNRCAISLICAMELQTFVL